MKKEVPMFADNRLHLTFDDVTLATGLCSTDSRSMVSLTSSLPKGYSLTLPVMTAAMDTITSDVMSKAILDQGGAIVHHRNQSFLERIKLLYSQRDHPLVNAKKAVNGVAVGLGVTAHDARQLITGGANLICIEVAHAYMTGIADAVKRIGPTCKEKGVLLMVGNFSSVDGTKWLRHETGDLVDIVKVSQGGGSCCLTRVRAGIGNPTLQAVIDLTEAETPYHVVADGGIRNSGALAKAIAAGACAGMLGGMLSGTAETPGDLIEKDGVQYKRFRGMASKDAKVEVSAQIKNVEGISTLVPYRGSVLPILQQIGEGLQSAVASTGFTNLEDFQKEAQFLRVSHSSQLESLPHAKLLKGS